VLPERQYSRRGVLECRAGGVSGLRWLEGEMAAPHPSERLVVEKVYRLLPIISRERQYQSAEPTRRDRRHTRCLCRRLTPARPSTRGAPIADLAAAGGWKGTEALQRCYLHADDATMLAVVLGGADLREKWKACGRRIVHRIVHTRLVGAQILAPSYTFVPARGDTIMTREQRLSGQPADTTRTERSYTLHNCRAQVYGTTAVAHCRYTAQISYPSAGADSTREFISTAVFVQQGKDWQIVASHPSLVRPR
jgi:hypothetical protein